MTRSPTAIFLVTNTKCSPNFIDINGNILTDFSKSRTGLGSVPLSPGALFTLILFRKLWWGNLGAVSALWGFLWESVSGCPISLVSLPSLLTGHIRQSLGKQRWAFTPWRTICAGKGNAISIFLSLSSESLDNALEPLRWAVVPQTVLLHRRRGSHRNSVMHLCPRSPYPICSFSALIFYHGFPYDFLWALCLGGDWSYCSLADSRRHFLSGCYLSVAQRGYVGCDGEGQPWSVESQ